MALWLRKKQQPQIPHKFYHHICPRGLWKCVISQPSYNKDINNKPARGMVFLSCQRSLSSKRKPNSCQRTLCSKNKTSLFWDNLLLQKLSVTE